MNAMVLEDHNFMELTDNELYSTEGGKPFWRKAFDQVKNGVVKVADAISDIAIVEATTVAGAMMGLATAGVPGAIISGAVGLQAGLQLID